MIALTIAPLISGNDNWEGFYYGFIPGALILIMTLYYYFTYKDIEYKESYAKAVTSSPRQRRSAVTPAEIDSKA